MHIFVVVFGAVFAALWLWSWTERRRQERVDRAIMQDMHPVMFMHEPKPDTGDRPFFRLVGGMVVFALVCFVGLALSL